METFIKQLSDRLTDMGFIVKPGTEIFHGITIDEVRLPIEWAGESPAGHEVVTFCESKFSIRQNGTIPNLDKAVGLAVQKIIKRKQRREKFRPTSRGKGASIIQSPGGVTLSIQFTDNATASIALDCLMENGLVAPAENHKVEEVS